MNSYLCLPITLMDLCRCKNSILLLGGYWWSQEAIKREIPIIQQVTQTSPSLSSYTLLFHVGIYSAFESSMVVLEIEMQTFLLQFISQDLSIVNGWSVCTWCQSQRHALGVQKSWLGVRMNFDHEREMGRETYFSFHNLSG